MKLLRACQNTALTMRSVALALFERMGISEAKPRPPSSLGLFGRYDGNIIGGAMVGLGMTLTGACPGTVLVQLTTGIRSGWYTLAGGVLGGILYTRLFHRKDCALPNEKLTVQTKFGIDTRYAVLAYEVMCVAFISLVTALGPKGTSVPLHPLLGGALIGAAQAASLILTTQPVGISTGYEVVGAYFWRLVKSLSGQDLKGVPRPPLRSVYFVAGVIAGSLALTRSIPSVVFETGIGVSASRGVLGGLVMVLGARIANGCTSGHGISGMSLFAVSSIVTVASMFAAGIGSALLMQ